MKKTALYEEHVKLGGRIVDFGGWALPVQYSSQIEEHLACRNQAALFDVSHMGEILIEGPGALEFVNHVSSNDLQKLPAGKAQYAVLCHENGGIVDDIINYKFSDSKILMIVNASNSDKDYAHLLAVKSRWKGANPGLRVENVSNQYSQIAIQGPMAQTILQPLVPNELADLKTFGFIETTTRSRMPIIIGRTGYTGEDGFEIYCPWEKGPSIWRSLLEAGGPKGLKPAGLGARDTLRTEMKYSLYGHEITDETNPLEAGLGWVVKFEKSDFVGKSALMKIRDAGLKRKLIGIKLLEHDRRIPRQGYLVKSPDGTRTIGVVTSGTQSPLLKESIAIAYVETGLSNTGQTLFIDIRGQHAPAMVVATPFYERRKS